MRDWPKAPRVCLLERIACNCTTWPASDWMLPCAVSMIASRSCSLARLSCVDLVCSVMVWPRRPVMASSRWPIDCVSSACRAPNTSAMAPMRPCISACALQDAGHPRFGIAGMVGGLRGSDRARLGRPPQRDDQRHEQAEKQQCAEGQRMAERDRGGAEPRDRLRKDGAQVIHVGQHSRFGLLGTDQNVNARRDAPVDAFRRRS